MERNSVYHRQVSLVRQAEAGHFSLPAEVIDLERRAQRLDAERRQGEPDYVTPARLRLAEGLARAAAEDAPWPNGEDVVAAEQKQRAARVRREALDDVTWRAQGAFVAAVVELTDTIIAEHLRPALEELLEEARAAVATTSPYGAATDVFLTAPKPAREAWLRLETLADRYAVLTTARSSLVRGSSRLDEADVFAELHNKPEVWPHWRRQVDPPWPTDSRRARLVWLVASPAVVWMPTVAEQDARFREFFAEDLARMEQSRHAALAVKARA